MAASAAPGSPSGPLKPPPASATAFPSPGTIRPPPLLIPDDLPPLKRARVTPFGAPAAPGPEEAPSASMRHPVAQGDCARVVTPLRPAAPAPAKPRAKAGRWTKREDETLRAAVAREGPRDGRAWAALALRAFGGARGGPQCCERWEKVLKLGLVKGPWTPAEDDVVRRAVGAAVAEPFNWADVAKLLPGRLTKQVRERWQNHLDPLLVKTPWTPAEDYLLVSLQALLGNRWNEISRAFTGRSENAVKNRWNSKQRRRFLGDAPPPAVALPGKAAAIDFREALLATYGADPLEAQAATILRALRADERHPAVVAAPVPAEA